MCLQFIGNLQETIGARTGWGAGKYTLILNVDDKLYCFIFREFKNKFNRMSIVCNFPIL